MAGQQSLSRLEQQGLIQCFDFTHELARNVLKDYLEEQGGIEIIGSKNATRIALKNALLTAAEVWTDRINARTLTFHT